MASVELKQMPNRENNLFQLWSNSSLRTKVTLTFITVMLLAIGAIVFITNRLTTTALTAQIGSSLDSLAEAKAVNIGNLLALQVSALQTLSLNRSLHDRLTLANTGYGTDSAEIQAKINTLDQQWKAADSTDFLVRNYLNNAAAIELLAFQETFPDHAEVFITDKYGGLLATTNYTSDYYQADEAWWQAAYNKGQGGIYVGEPEFDESSQTLGINMAVPIRLKNSGEVIGILRTTYKLSALIESLAQFQFAKTGRVDLLFSGNQMLTIKKDGLFEMAQMEPTQVVELQAAIGTIAELEFEGKPNLIVQSPIVTILNNPAIANLGWRLIVRQDRAEALAVVNQQTSNIWFLALIIMVITVAVAFVLGHQLANPLTDLAKTVTRFSQGNLQARASEESSSEIGILAVNFNQMAEKLQQILTGLEQQVAQRTHALEVSMEVGRRLSTLLDETQLAAEVVEQVRAAFNYYYAHIYLFDAKREKLVMAAGTGEAGRSMLQHGHTLAKGEGVIGRAAATNTIVLATDISQEPDWQPNPLLPETQTEVAVPITAGAEILGVLSVQHNVPGSLTETEANLLQALANQVAIALQNARAYAQAQHRAEREALISAIGQKIQSATSVDNAMQIAVRELGRAVGDGQTRVRLRTTPSATGQE